MVETLVFLLFGLPFIGFVGVCFTIGLIRLVTWRTEKKVKKGVDNNAENC